MDENASSDVRQRARTAKACRPGAPVAGAKSRGSTSRGATETTKPGLSGVSTQISR